MLSVASAFKEIKEFKEFKEEKNTKFPKFPKLPKFSVRVSRTASANRPSEQILIAVAAEAEANLEVERGLGAALNKAAIAQAY